MTTKHLVVKIQNLVVSHESQPVKANAVPSFEIITVAVHNAKMVFE